MTTLSTEQLTVAQDHRVLIEALDWQAGAGQFWCVLGQNGVGKSTLLQVLAGLRQPASGRVMLDGQPLAALAPAALARLRGLMPQSQADAFSISVLETVLVGRTPWRLEGGWGWDSTQDRRCALAALERVGLAGMATRDVLQLSGGERQRVALATLLAQAPAILLLDEPTAHQDVARQLAMMRLVAALASDHAIVSTCHDINLAARFATHVLVLARGQHWLGPVQEILRVEVLEQAFGCHFALCSIDGFATFVAS